MGCPDVRLKRFHCSVSGKVKEQLHRERERERERVQQK